MADDINSDRNHAAKEWLEADGLGGFAMGSSNLIPKRRYHSLLLAATQPPAGRLVLVNAVEAWIDTRNGPVPLSSFLYQPDVIYPVGANYIESFRPDPWPTWTFLLPDNSKVQFEVFVPHKTSAVCLSWSMVTSSQAGRPVGTLPPPISLRVRPLISARDYHSLHRQNDIFSFFPTFKGPTVSWKPYESLPCIVASSNGDYQHKPTWNCNFAYEEERNRGFACTEDLASPGEFSWDLSRERAVLWFSWNKPSEASVLNDSNPIALYDKCSAHEAKRRRSFANPLELAGSSYLVKRGEGETIVAGYPWFVDWGRDTFISIRGLCLATGNLSHAASIIMRWSQALSQGMLPNRFMDGNEDPEYNSVDASLWFIIAAWEFLDALKKQKHPTLDEMRQKLSKAIDSILTHYHKGTRYGIRCDNDCLLRAGAPGVQLTWMDAKIGDLVVTPRSGKPVEIEALWLNALHIGAAFSERWKVLYETGLRSFKNRFWNESRQCLFDVVDVDHIPGRTDGSLRPNQILAVGGLPLQLLDGERARKVVETVEKTLLTPIGLRTLAPGDRGYTPVYRGGPLERDKAYHQGTVWPWLLGPFIEAWVRVKGESPQIKAEARQRFFVPLISHLNQAGLGHISEIADAEYPHTPSGCPFQAWSVAEAIRIDKFLGNEN